MMIDQLQKEIAKAMKGKDRIRLETLKLLSSSLHNAKIAKMGKLTKDEEIGVIQKEAKKRKDAIEAYSKVGAEDRANKEKKELEILQEYLPKQLDRNEIEKLVDGAIKSTKATNIKDMGKVIGKVMSEAKGRADGKLVSELVKDNLD